MKLNEIATLSLGIMKNRYTSSIKTMFKYKIIESTDIGEIGINKALDQLQELYFENKISDKMTLKKNDILMKMFPPYSISYIEEEYVGCVVVSNIAIIRAIKIDSNYLYLYLRNNKVLLYYLTEGTTIKLLSLNSLKSLNIDNNISEQDIEYKCRIAKLLDRQEFLLKRKIKLINFQKEYYFKLKGERNGK